MMEDQIHVLPEEGADVEADIGENRRSNLCRLKMARMWRLEKNETENPKSFKYIPEWMDDASVEELL